MRRLLTLLLFFSLLFSLAGCQGSGSKLPDPDHEPPTTTLGEVPPEILHTDSNTAGTPVPYCAQYVRTDGPHDGVVFPCVRIVGSLQELKDYYTKWREHFHLERRDTVYSDSTPGFLDVCDQYDEAFFTENYLLFVLLEEYSGSVRHEVRSVEQTTEGLLSISIDRKVPEAGTEDMAQWHIIFELSRDYLVESSLDTMIFVDGTASFLDDKPVPPQAEAEFQEPPIGTLHTPEGDTPLIRGGYSWFAVLGNDLEQGTEADQGERPLPADVFTPVQIPEKYAEPVYTPILGSDAYAPTNGLGYFLKLSWEQDPDSVAFTCWPEEVWHDGSLSEVEVDSQGDCAFYAKNGGYVYEIKATWNDVGRGYHGTANYYVYVIGGTDETQLTNHDQ